MKVSEKDGLLPVDSKTGIEQTGNRLSLNTVEPLSKSFNLFDKYECCS